MASPSSSNALSVPQGLIVVDRFGKQSWTKKTIEPGDRLAHPPAVRLTGQGGLFKGTIPGFVPTGRDGDTANLITYQIEQDKNLRVLEEAVFYLSQSDVGRSLLYEAKSRGFSFVFDRRKTEERAAAGICEFDNKLVPLHPDTHPAQLMLTLAHELDHMRVIGKGLRTSASNTLATQIRGSRLLEASARATEARVAFGLATLADTYFKPPSVVEAFTGKLPGMAAAARNALTKTKGVFNDLFMRNVFMAFFEEKATLSYYDRDTMTYVENAISPKEKNTRVPEAQRLAPLLRDEILLHQTAVSILPYLKEAPNLDDPRYAALMPDSAITDRVDKITSEICKHVGTTEAARRMAITVQNDKPSKIGLFLDRAKAMAGTLIPSALAKPVVYSTPQPAAPAEFRSIMLPSIANMGDSRFSDDTIRALAKGVSDFHLYPNASDRLHFALTYAQGRPSHAYVSELVELGLRVPITALPEDYQCRLLSKFQYYSRGKGMDGNGDFSKADILLFNHWRTMAAKGINPLGDLKESSQDHIGYANLIAKAVGPVAAKAAPVNEHTAATLAAWAREQIAQPRPPEQTPQLILRAARRDI